MFVFCSPIDNVPSTSVAAARTSGATSILVVDASHFGNPSTNAPIRLSFFRGSTPVCVLKCTGVSGNTLTVPTGQAGDAALNPGDTVQVNVTAEEFADIHSAINTISLTPGPQGYQGYQGGAGSQGGSGSQGYQGYQGFQGNTGGAGGTGSQGPQGYQGNQGNTGAGTQGSAGSAGPQGYQGNQGNTGAGTQGSAGSAGPQGYQGNQGNTGGTGSQGSQGYQGYQGFQGNTGVGSAGPQGYQGVAGTGGGGGGTPGGSTGQLQYNNSGVFGGTASTVYSTSGNIITVTAQNAGDTPIVVKAASSPTARLFTVVDTSNAEKFAIGADFNVYKNNLLFMHATGPSSLYVGANAGNTAISTAYGANTGVGVNALTALTTGYFNTFFGYNAGRSLIDGAANLGIGYSALGACTSGSNNVGIGNSALGACTTGSYNVGVGPNALAAVTTASSLTAFGSSVFNSCSSGANNVGVGTTVFGANNGSTNTGIGANVFSQELGNYNIGIGSYVGTAGSSTNSGTIALGYVNYYYAGTGNFNYSVSIGYGANTYRAGSYCVTIGSQAGGGSSAITGDNCTLIGAYTVAGGGYTYASAIGYGATVSQSNAMALGGTGSNYVDVGIGTATPGAKIHAVADSATKIGLILQQAASATANYLNCETSTGTVITAIRPDGSLALPTLADSAVVNSSLYFSSTTSKLSYRDSSGTIHAI